MKLQVARWGNSLALRIPVEVTRAAGLREGSVVNAELTASGDIVVSPALRFDRARFAERSRALRARMPVTEPVSEALRDDARY
ncbi:MAG TPA: AbrB/MazE/SpoVT family DNA-binding domain-containing protein [Burkholderiaceae bacterium]